MKNILVFAVIAFILFSNPGLLALVIIGAVIWFMFRSKGKQNSGSRKISFPSLNFSNDDRNDRSNDREYSENHNKGGFTRTISPNGGKRFGSTNHYDDSQSARLKEAEEDAYFYRKHGGPRWKVEAADKDLGYSQRDSDYLDNKYEKRCRECNEPESHCKCCRKCDSYPCNCCSECGEPERNCRCCRRCESYPCNCCDECGQPDRYCKCCRDCNRYPCSCCRECRYADCRCCRRCDSYPCRCD